MAEQKIVPAAGIVVSTAIGAGGVWQNHAEGIVLSTTGTTEGDAKMFVANVNPPR